MQSYTIKKRISWQMILCFMMILISLLVAILILTDFKKPGYYWGLFSLPLSFGALSVIFYRLYYEIPSNLGISIILVLLFTRMVISPFFMYLGNYIGTITKNVEKNTYYAILLVIYEELVIFITLFIKNQKEYKKATIDIDRSESYYIRPKISSIYKALLILALLINALCLYKAPVLLSGYRTIFDISEENFTGYEDSQLVAKYGTTFMTKLALVTGQYLTRALLILVPAYFIINASSKKTRPHKFIAFVSCFIPLFFIGGTIARSLIYIVCLLFLYNYMFNNIKATKKSMLLLVMAGITVIAWWIYRSGTSGGLFEQFSRRFSAYFSGVNVVSGVFNLPKDVEYRLRYFLYDFSNIPYGNTIFRPAHDNIHLFFNAYNSSSGQIPTNIGMGYYYFGPILAPIYSIIFTCVSFNSAVKLKENIYAHPIRCIRLLLMTFSFSMGIIMYDIDITMTSFFTLLLPMYIMERISYKKKKVL